MGLYMATTKIEAEQTAAEICVLLRKHGANRIMHEYDHSEPDGRLASITFTIFVPERGEMPFRLPVKPGPVEKILAMESNRPHRKGAGDPKFRAQQAERTAWRLALRWVEAQLALIEVGMAELVEVFMPYIAISQEQTFYEKLAETGFKALPAPKL